jgi:hypothetical protein
MFRIKRKGFSDSRLAALLKVPSSVCSAIATP